MPVITDPTDGYFQAGWRIQFYHIPSDTSVGFKAFLTEYTDNFVSNWNEEPVFGRMDPLMTFANTTRSISLGWTIVAKDETEAARNLRNADLLLSMQYPSYDSTSASSIAAPPLFRVRFANLIQEGGESMVCAITGFNFAPDLEQGFFPGTTTRMISPKVIQMSCELKVLHTKDLGWATGTKRWRSGSGMAHGGSISVGAARKIASGDLGERKAEADSTEQGPNPVEETAQSCAMLGSSAEKLACIDRVSAANAEEAEAIRTRLEESANERGETYDFDNTDAAVYAANRQARNSFRQEQRQIARDQGLPRPSNAELDRQFAENNGWTEREAFGAYRPTRPEAWDRTQE